jgi:LuxR family transcriptional regulator, positive regulator of biofilm formation
VKKRVVIHSPQQTNSEALAIQIERNLGYSCVNNNGIALINFEVPKNVERTLYLIDCIGQKISDIRKRIKQQVISRDDHCDVALFNLATDIDNDIEIDAFVEGYKGVFFENIPLNLFLKGLSAIFEGQMWYSRKVLNRFYRKAYNNLVVSNRNNIDLTLREKEILDYIANGLRNDEIAEKLCISAHTVKSHIYNLFKKLDVPNRVQAVIWATNHRLSI